MRDLWVLLLLLGSAWCWPQSQSTAEPHDSMVGTAPRPGTEALQPRPDQMRGIVDCDGELGAVSGEGQVWPSPDPLPSASPAPPRPVPVSANFNASHAGIAPTIRTPQLPAPVCDDDETFFDSNLLSCRDYTMNKELCIVADRYANHLGQTARHACCKCGGGKHVQPIQKKLCVRPKMGDDCIEEEMYATTHDIEDADKMKLPLTPQEDNLPGTIEIKDLDGDDAPGEDDENLGSVGAVERILEPDAIVFRNRNFIGYPREPDSVPTDPTFDEANPHDQYTTRAYVVRPRETIEEIAKKFQISTSLLVSFNQDVADPLVLKSGDVLLIPEPRRLEVKTVTPLQSPLEGGVDVIISGYGFIFPTYCKFGDMISRATYVVEETIVCPSPGQTEPGVYQLSVSDGKGGFEATTFSVHYTVGLIPFCDENGARPSWCRPRMAIYNVSPLRVAQNTPADITVIGTGFNSSTICRIGGDLVDTTVVSRTQVICHFPGKDPGINGIVLEQGGISASTQYEIAVFSTLTITAISPLNGPDSASTELTITGTTFRTTTVCKFNEITVPATIVSQTEIKCLAPPHEVGIVGVDVSNTGNLFTGKPADFEYTHIHVFSLSQSSGSYAGGDVITLTGSGFYPGTFCRFGPDVALAEYVSLKEIRCRTPAQKVAKVVRVQASLDGVKGFTDEDIQFSYFADITEVRPTKGRAIGGDDIHVFGNGFDVFTTYVCRFGAQAMPAIPITTTHLQCTSPAGSGVVDFTLESKDFQYRKNAAGEFLTFEYVSTQTIDLFAVFPSFADVRVETPVKLSGSGFAPGALCRFGDKTTTSEFVNANEIVCHAPARDLAEIVEVSVSQDGGATWSGRLTQFEYRAVVESLDPPLGPVQGGNTVRVKGHGFNLRSSLCVFGNKVVAAVYKNQFEMTCVAPASEASAKVPFAVTTNSTILFDSYLEFKFTDSTSTKHGIFYVYSRNPDFIVSSADPDSGSIFGGETTTVHGEGFDASSHCMFGDRTVKAVFLDAKTITCVTPPHPPGKVALQVVNFHRANGYNATSLSSTFTFAPPVITQISPEEGFVTGDETVKITGTFLGGAATCRFGQKSTPVLHVTATEVECKTPKSEVARTVSVELGYDGEGVSDTEAKFVYHPVISKVTPESGFISTQSQSVTFVGEGFAGDPILCVFEETVFVPATIKTNTEISCVVPTSSKPHSAVVKLTNSEREITLGKKTFQYKYQPKVHSIFPTFGATTGGTTVVVVGVGLSFVSKCNFGTNSVAATAVSDVMVRCAAPPSSVGIVGLTLTSDIFTTNGADYNYRVLTTRVDSIFPTTGSIFGQTLVTLRGSGFVPGAFCKFGDQEVPVIFSSPTRVSCFSPAVASDSTVTVEVSQSGGDGFSVNGNTFVYTTAFAAVDHIDPSFGDPGDTINIFGAGFQQSSTCFIGPRRGVKTTFINENHIECEIPRSGSQITDVVQVATKPTFLPGGNVVFRYRAPEGDASTMAIRDVSPNHGPTAGKTNVIVNGVNFPKRLLCLFGDTVANAQFISPNQVSCQSPPHISGTVLLEVVTKDRRTFTTSLIKFTYDADAATPDNSPVDSAAVPVLTQITPSSAQPDDEITLIGRSFSSVGFCIFHSDSDSILVAAEVTDSTHVTCVVPEPLDTMGTTVQLKYLSIGGTESSSLEFKFVS